MKVGPSSPTRIATEALEKKDTKTGNTAEKKDHARASNHQASGSSLTRLYQLAAKIGIPLSGKKLKEQSAPLPERARKRLQLKQVRQQQNLESVLALAQNYCSEAATQEELDPDWYYSFMEMAEDIHSGKMQELWARILASELSRPGNFSLKSLNLLKQITAKEAQTFQRACSLLVKNKQQANGMIIFGYSCKASLFLFKDEQDAMSLGRYGLSYSEVLTLIDAGLLLSSELESGAWAPGSSHQFWFDNKPLNFKAKRGQLRMSYYRLSHTGFELSRLLGDRGNQAYLEGLRQLLSPVCDLTPG